VLAIYNQAHPDSSRRSVRDHSGLVEDWVGTLLRDARAPAARGGRSAPRVRVRARTRYEAVSAALTELSAEYGLALDRDEVVVERARA